MRFSNVVNTICFRVLAVVCGLWQLHLTMANRLSQLNPNPAVTQFGMISTTMDQCFEKIIFAKSRSPAAVSHLATYVTFDFVGLSYTVPKPIVYVKVETLDDTYGGATVEIIGGAIGTDNILLSITDGNRKPFFKSNIMVSMYCDVK